MRSTISHNRSKSVHFLLLPKFISFPTLNAPRSLLFDLMDASRPRRNTSGQSLNSNTLWRPLIALAIGAAMTIALLYINLSAALADIADLTLRQQSNETAVRPIQAPSTDDPFLEPAPSPPPAPSWDTLVVVLATTGPDAIGWDGSPAHLPGNPRVCIDPAPFGAQCTMHATDGLAACLAIPGCAALTCPDPAPYVAPRTDIHSHGPVCQVRRPPPALTTQSGKERRPPMHAARSIYSCCNFAPHVAPPGP
jgi:hypothetical protein